MMLLLLLPMIGLTGCKDDDKDLPQVKINVDMQDVVVDNDVVYIVKGDEFKINSITCTSLNGQASALGVVCYYWNGVLNNVSNIEPYAITYDTNEMTPGNYLFQIKTNVFQVDKSLATAWITYKVKIVEDASEIPGATTPGEVTDLKTTQLTES